MGFFSQLRSPNFWGMFSGILAAVAFFWAIAGWITDRFDDTVDKRVDTRLAPYLFLQSAQISNQSEEYSAAISELWGVWNSCNARSEISPYISLPVIKDCLGDSNVDVFADNLMWAVINASNHDFHENSGYLMEVVDQLGNDLDRTAWRLETLGVFHLRQGDYAEALKNLEKSILRFRANQDYRFSAWGHWYRALVLTFLSRKIEAVEELENAIICSPREFRPFLTPGEEYALGEERIFATLTNQNPDFDDSLREVVGSVNLEGKMERCSDLIVKTY